METDPGLTHYAATLIAQADSVVVFSGAGMSAESGVPTFRDAQEGLWATFDPEDLATASGFARNPRLVFGWYLSRLLCVDRVVPHEGYEAIADLTALVRSLVVVTQNVDGLHGRTSSAEVIELHGSLGNFRCFDRGHPIALEVVRASAIDHDGSATPPRCDVCGSLARPGVVWFGEMLPPAAYHRACEVVRSVDVVIVVGTSGLVYPAADLPRLGQQAGAKLVVINPTPSPLCEVAEVSLMETASQALPSLVKRVWTLKQRGQCEA